MITISIVEKQNDLIIIANIDHTYTSLIDIIEIVFPSWKTTKSGCWCTPLNTNVFDNYEFGIYHEPCTEEYANTFTLQTFINDDVDICQQLTDISNHILLDTISSNIDL